MKPPTIYFKLIWLQLLTTKHRAVCKNHSSCRNSKLGRGSLEIHLAWPHVQQTIQCVICVPWGLVSLEICLVWPHVQQTIQCVICVPWGLASLKIRLVWPHVPVQQTIQCVICIPWGLASLAWVQVQQMQCQLMMSDSRCSLETTHMYILALFLQTVCSSILQYSKLEAKVPSITYVWTIWTNACHSACRVRNLSGAT
jgi:hypothetical protein